MYCYLLFASGGRQTYIGATVDPDRRLRQHNGEITGGARRTKGGSWQRACYVGPFPNWVSTLQFEWAWKHHGRGKPRVSGKLEALWNLLHTERSTRNAVPFRFWAKQLFVLFEQNSLQLLNKIDYVPFLQSKFRPPISNISSVPNFPDMSSQDLSALALRVEELAFLVNQIQQRLDAAPASGPAPKVRKPRKAKSPAPAPGPAPAAAEGAEAQPKKKRGRKPATATGIAAVAEVAVAEESATETQPKKRGRKPKATAETVAATTEGSASESDAKPKRGRKPKVAVEAVPEASSTAAEPATEGSASEAETKPKKGRGKAKPKVAVAVEEVAPINELLSSLP